MIFGLLLLNLAGLIVGAQLLIRGALAIAKKYNFPEFLIGLTLLTVGTSLPELMITVTGSVERLHSGRVSELIVSEIIGSDIGLAGLILGISGLFGILKINKKELNFQGTFLIGAILLLWFFAKDGFLARQEGLVMLAAYGYYLFHVLFMSRQRPVPHEKLKTNPRNSWLFLIWGLILVIFTSNQVVENGVLLANQWGVSQSLVGLFLIGLGTSLPELIVSLTSAMKRSTGLTVGNIVGSSIFNILFALSTGTMISGFVVEREMIMIDIPFLLLISATALLFFKTRGKFEKKESFLVLGMYGVYTFFKVISG